VILRPSKEAARRTQTITSIWGEEIVFEDVPVRRNWVAEDAQPPTTAPATTRPGDAVDTR
jgi:hypothetical protein